jgi:hypothetical protein
MTTRAEFVETVLSYVGTPFHHQGRAPGVGLDCPGPIICAARHHGLVAADFDVTAYGRIPDGFTLQAHCETYMDRIELADAIMGDVILAGFRNGPPQHLGVIVDHGQNKTYWVQAEGYRHKKVIKSRLVFGERFLQFHAAYRIRGLV